MKREAVIPSMFHRRLVLLVALVGVVSVVLVGQLYRVTIVQGDKHRVAAERVLVDRELLPTYRGRILDRNGLVLAEDHRCYEVMVDYRLITGAWAETQAGAEARREYREIWDELSVSERAEKKAEFLPKYERELDNLWVRLAQLGDVPVETINDRCREIEQRVERMALSVWKRWKKQREEEWQTTLTLEDVKSDIREQRIPHVILSGIQADRETAYRRLAENGPRLSRSRPGVSIRPAGIRSYPWEVSDVRMDRSSLPGPLRASEPQIIHVSNVAGLLLGNMRTTISPEEYRDRPLYGSNGELMDLGGYLINDPVGSTGLERTFETVLRGSRGIRTEHFDTEEVQRFDPMPGRDVVLTLDVRLQSRVAAILSPEFGLTRVQPWHGNENQFSRGTPLDAAAVVIDIRSGEILAMASAINRFPYEEVDADRYPELSKQLNPAWAHLALDKPVAPGSIVKPLMLCSAVTEGAWAVDQVAECNGHYFEKDREHYRCWIYRPRFGHAVHGPLGPVEAIARSCNIYFYTIGAVLGAERQSDWYKAWGLESTFNLGVSVAPGTISDPRRAEVGEVLRRGIGQGRVAWTPLHAAAALSTLARGGYRLEPILVSNPVDSADRLQLDMNLNDEAVNLALQGLGEVVNNQQYGGARQIDVDPDPDRRQVEPIFNADGVFVWGKTGTAQQNWPTHIVEYDADGQPVLDHAGNPVVIVREQKIGAHSWFVGLVGRAPNGDDRVSGLTQPEYAIAVLVEWGGSGSRCAGPIANQIVHALQKEGYLGG